MPRKPPSERLHQHEISQVKEWLWAKKRQVEIVGLFKSKYGKNIDQGSISRIKTGILGRSVPWPDGGPGGFSGERESISWSDQAERLTKWPDEVQQRMLSVVNERRTSDGMPELPLVAPEFQRWLEQEEPDSEADGLNLMKLARLAEDERRCLIMDTFDEIVTERQRLLRMSDLQEQISGTSDRELTEVPERSSEGELSYSKIEWEDVVFELSPKNRVVREIIKNNDFMLAEALCILLAQIDPTNLDEKVILERARSIKKKLVDLGTQEKVEKESTYVQQLNRDRKDSGS